MKDHIVHLTDGTTLEINVSFATLYYMMKDKALDKLMKKEKSTEADNLELAAHLIYVILRSNGRKVTFDEALQLTPLDTEELEEMIDDFTDKLECYKKKEAAKQMMGKNIPKKK